MLMTSGFCSFRSVLFVRRKEVTLRLRIKPLVGVGGGEGTEGSFSTLDRLRDVGGWTFTEPIVNGGFKRREERLESNNKRRRTRGQIEILYFSKSSIVAILFCNRRTRKTSYGLYNRSNCIFGNERRHGYRSRYTKRK